MHKSVLGNDTASLTYELHHSQVSLPPEILLHVRPKRRQAVVGVHEHVDEAVHHCTKKRWKKEIYDVLRLLTHNDDADAGHV